MARKAAKRSRKRETPPKSAGEYRVTGAYSPEQRAAIVKRLKARHTAATIQGTIDRPAFHVTTDLRATSDTLWQSLAEFRRRLMQGGEYRPAEWQSLLIDIRDGAHRAGLRPRFGNVEYIAASLPEARAGDLPGGWDDEPDNWSKIILTACGEAGWIQLHDLCDGFSEPSGGFSADSLRQLAVEWAESWMNARERQLCGAESADARSDTTAALPTMRDLADRAGISDDTFRRVREAAGIEVKLKGAAARNRRYPRSEVDRLIAAALAGNFIERTAMAEKWARWGKQESRK